MTKRVLLIALIFAALTPLRAADTPAGKPSSDKIHQAVYKQVADQMGDTFWVQKGADLVHQECRVRGLECILDNLYRSVQKAGGNVTKASVCVGEKEKQTCVPALAYAQGGVHYALGNLLYYKNKPIAEVSGQFVTLVTEYGLHSEQDRKAAMKYFYTLLDLADKDCGSGFQLSYGSAAKRADQRQRQERQMNACASEVGGLPALAMLAKDGNEKKEAAERIYAFLKDKYNSNASSIVIPGATTALGVLGTPRAYALLEEFLTDETIPSTGGNILNSLSFEGMAKNVLRGVSNLRGGNSRYLNRINEKFQYIDNGEASRQGWKSTQMNHEKIQYPYGNLFEDIGRMLASQSKTNTAARRVAKSIVSKANAYAKNNENAAGDIHYPLVLGILDGWRAFGKTYIYEPSPKLLNLFYKGDWWDINEGTQRRVHRLAYEFAKARGWKWKAPQKDQKKQDRYVYNARLMEIGSGADLASIPVAMGTLVASLPAMARGMSGAVKVLTSRKAWIGTKDYFKTLPAVAQQRAASYAQTAGNKIKNIKQSVSGAGRTKPAAVKTTPRAAAPVKSAPVNAVNPMARQVAEAGTKAAQPLSGVSKAKIESKLTGPLADKVAAAQKRAVAYGERSLMPRAPKNAGNSPIKYRSDNLVYMEVHPTDPGKAVFYYADDMGRVNTAKEVPMSTYDNLMKGLSREDRAMLGRIGDSYASEVSALRVEREHDRLTALAKEITRLQDQRQQLANSRTYHLTEGGTFGRVKKVDDEIAALEKEVNRTIWDMSRNNMGSESDLRMMFRNELGHPVSNSSASTARGTLKYTDRSLMPETKGKVPQGIFEPRADGLLYMEAHPTDPTKARFYYSEGPGQYARVRDVPMKEYEAFVKGLSETDKVTLQQSARAYASEINKTRVDLEHTRLTDLAKDVTRKKDYVTYLKSKSQGTAAERRQIRALEDEIAGLEAEANRTIRDMANNKMGTERNLRDMYQNSLGSPVKPQAKRARLEISDDYDEAYAQVREIGKQMEALETERARIVQSGSASQRDFARVRAIDDELRYLKSEETSGILQMEKKGMGDRRSLTQRFDNDREPIPSFAKPQPVAPVRTAVAYGERSLMPRAPKNAGNSPIKYRSDNLVYMEVHPTDPGKAVFYYADDMGRVNTAKEVPMSTYDNLMKGLSREDRAMLGRIGDSYASEVSALRVEREHDRLTALAKEITRLQDQRQQLANSRTYHLTEGGTFGRVKKVDDEIAALEKEVNRTIWDMSRNNMGSESDLRMMFRNELGHPVSNSSASTARGTLKYTDRSLMPETKGKVPQGIFEPRADGLLYMEAHPTDPTKARFYYSEGPGQYARVRDVPMKEYEAFVKGLSETDKVTLQQSARAYASEINKTRVDLEHTRLTDLAKDVTRKKDYVTYLKSKSQGTAAERRQIRALEDEIAGLEAEANRTIRDMANNKMGTERNLRDMYQNSLGSPVKPQAKRARLEISDDYDEAYAQVREIGKQMEALETERARIVQSGSASQRDFARVRAIDDELRYLKSEETSGILQMEKKGMGDRRSLTQQFDNDREPIPTF